MQITIQMVKNSSKSQIQNLVFIFSFVYAKKEGNYYFYVYYQLYLVSVVFITELRLCSSNLLSLFLSYLKYLLLYQ